MGRYSRAAPYTRCEERYEGPSDGEDHPRPTEDRSSVGEVPDRYPGGGDRNRRPADDEHPQRHRIRKPITRPPGHLNLPRGGGAPSLTSIT